MEKLMKLSRIARLIILTTCLVIPSLSWAQHQKTQDLIDIAQKELMQGVKLIKSGQLKQGVARGFAYQRSVR